MRELGPDRLSEDGRLLIARDPESGDVFSMRTDQVRSLLAPAPRQLEITMESSLSPRDIQSRIRRGESPAAVAESAGVPIERIEGFATPVLAEREYMAEQARKTALRRKHVDGAPLPLGSLIDEVIVEAGGVPEDAAWDSWRREDGRWTISVTPAAADEPATFIYDAKGRYVLPADDLAHELVNDIAVPDSADMAIDAISSPAAEPVVAQADPVVPTEQIEAEDLLEPHAPVHSLKEVRDRKALEQLALTELDDLTEESEHDSPRDDELEHHLVEHDIAVPDTPSPSATDAPRKKQHERRRVPSWDEIMFGGKDG